MLKPSLRKRKNFPFNPIICYVEQQAGNDICAITQTINLINFTIYQFKFEVHSDK
jgi:hypothetical protein